MEIFAAAATPIDAAIATALALSVVDQASSGLGGGGFMVIYLAKEQKSFALDFRETAPAASQRELYMKDGKPVPSASLTGALAVAVPGEVAGLIEARKRFGSLPLSVLAAPAIQLASEGFRCRCDVAGRHRAPAGEHEEILRSRSNLYAQRRASQRRRDDPAA